MMKNAVGVVTAAVVAWIMGVGVPSASAQSNNQYGGLGGKRDNSLVNVQATFNGTEQSLAHDQSYYCSYRVYLEAGVKYQIRMDSEDFRPCIWLQSGSKGISPVNACVLGGSQAVQQATGSTASLWVRVANSGYYDVVANTEFGGQTGAYTMKMWR